MNLKFGYTIDKIRKQKDIPIKDLVNDIMSPSTYHRFKDGEIDTSITKFHQLLANMNIQYSEFIFIRNDYQGDKLSNVLILIEVLLVKNEKKNILHLKGRVDSDNWADKQNQRHISSLLTLLTDSHAYGQDDWKNNELIQYLRSVGTWTHYEVSLFKISLIALPSHIIDICLRNVIHSYEAYREVTEYQHHICRILINAIISFLSRKEVSLARKWYRHLVFQEVNDHFLFEKYFQQLLGHYLDFAEGNKHAKERFPKFVESARLLHSNQLADKTSVMNQWMIENYN